VITLHSTTFPDNPEDIGPWLDHQLVATTLSELIAELCSIRPKEPRPESVESAKLWLGDDLPNFLKTGLTKLGQEKIKELLARPVLLLPLQEIALFDGGEYWANLLDKQQSPDAALKVGLTGQQSCQTPTSILPTQDEAATNKAAQWQRLAALSSLAAAILVTVVLYGPDLPSPAEKGASPASPELTRGSKTPPTLPIKKTLEEFDISWSSPDALATLSPPDAAATLATELSDWLVFFEQGDTTIDDLKGQLGQGWLCCENVLVFLQKAPPNTYPREIGVIFEELQKDFTDLTEQANKQTTQSADPLKKQSAKSISRATSALLNLKN
jgi:hypothetical protein